MNCPRCNAKVAFMKDRCDNCGQDLKTYRKVISLSNIYYNKGLEQAKVRDLSGAIRSLKQSLEFNKLNTNARNLLGLIYFEEGEIVSALSEWVISKNFQEKNNDADQYMNAIQSTPNKLDSYNQTIKKYATGYILEESDHLMPERKAYSNKGSYGKILIIAGNEIMSGAAYFAAEAALRMGAGLVKVLSDAGNRQILQTRLPEILFGERKDLEESLEWCDCILFGPGVGVSEEMKEMLEMVLKKGKKPLVIDADGLNIISRFNMKIDYPYGTIMTPHLMEAARLMSCDITQIKEDLCQSAQDLAEKYHCTAVLKDATTIVAREDDLVYINQSGNDGMATGGSGDILAGMIIGLLGEGLSVHEAAVHGVYLHGLAGDHAKHDLGAYSMIASDIIAHIKDVTGGNYEPVL